jgi:hypothetical protein
MEIYRDNSRKRMLCCVFKTYSKIKYRFDLSINICDVLYSIGYHYALSPFMTERNRISITCISHYYKTVLLFSVLNYNLGTLNNKLISKL